MRTTLFLSAIALSIAPICLKAQTKIEGHWGKPYLNVAYSTAATNDGGYILTGLTKNGINDDYGDIVVIKLNSHADTQWTFTYGGPFLEGGNCVIQTADGGYLVSGHTQDFGAVDCDAFMMKLDSMGNHQWFKIAGSYADDIAEGTIELPGGGYAYAGITESYGNADTSSRQRHFYVVKTNSTGDTVWTKCYSGGNTEYGYSIASMPAGGFLAVGWSSYQDTGAKKGWLLRLNESGDTLWTRYYSSSTNGDTKFFKILPTLDGGYILAGITNQTALNSSKGIAVKLDANGNDVWKKTYGALSDGVELHDVAQLPNGNYMFAGYSFAIDTTGNVYILTTDTIGTTTTDEYCGGIYSYASGIALHGNGSYFIAGATNSYGNAYGDIYWMEKIYPSASVANVSVAALQLFPNPVSGISEIVLPQSISNQTVVMEITSITGIQISKQDNLAANNLFINSSNMKPGVYFYKISCNDGKAFVGKFIVE